MTFAEVYYTPGPQKPVDVSHDFFFNLLKQAIHQGSPEKELSAAKISTKPYSGQGRVLQLLEVDKYYDIVWTANTAERNESLLPIPFPLFRGGLGLRGLVIREEDKAVFRDIYDHNDLKGLIICQGRHWPDSVILKQAGLTVAEISHFDAMLAMLTMGRCDAIALSVFEGAAELKAMASEFPNLVFFTEIAIYYDLVMNFYVNKENTALAERVHRGLMIMEETGEYDQLLNTHRLTKDVISTWNADRHRIIRLPNPKRPDISAQLEKVSSLVN